MRRTCGSARPVNRKYSSVWSSTGKNPIVAPYSVRAQPGGTVSMPLLWDEVHRALDPRKFTIFTAAERIAARGDPLEGFFRIRPNVPEVVARLGRRLGA